MYVHMNLQHDFRTGNIYETVYVNLLHDFRTTNISEAILEICSINVSCSV